MKISLNFVPNDSINNFPSLVQIMAWRRSGDKPLSETMMVSLPTHICVTRPQWVNSSPAVGAKGRWDKKIYRLAKFRPYASNAKLCVFYVVTPPQITADCYFNSLRPRPNRRHFADDIFKCIFENENEWISPSISLKFVPKVRINNIPALVQIMAWRRSGDKPLSEPMMVSLPTHICVTRPQWVNSLYILIIDKSPKLFIIGPLRWESTEEPWFGKLFNVMT